MELSVINQKLAMDSRDIAKEKLRYIIASYSDEEFANEFVGLVDKVFQQKDEGGYVYIVYDKNNYTTKIGKAKNIEKRLKTLSCSNLSLILYGYMKCKDYSKTENKLHQIFKERKIQREWFSVKPKEAYEALCKLQDEYGYKNVNPVCVEASTAVVSIVEKHRQKLTA